MQVRIDDNVDVLRLELELAEIVGQRARMVDAIDVANFCVKFIANARLHQNVLAARLNQQAGQS